MISFKANGKKFSIPEGWDEMTLNQTIELSKIQDKNNTSKFISILTGLQIEDCIKISEKDLIKMFIPVIQFVKDPVNIEEMMEKEKPESIKIGEKIYDKFFNAGQMVWAQHLNLETITKNSQLNDLQKLPDVISICIQTPKDFSEELINILKKDVLLLPLFDALSIGGFFLKSIRDFYKPKRFKNDVEYTAEQIRAGIKEFDKFGAFNSIDALAGGDITKWNEVVMLPMSDVMLKLMMNEQKYRYEKKYHDIISRKK